ncbi:MAG: TIGR00282 family metallophosphoesterase [Candidatus Aminicenantes bacterium]|nr:TIGR00282 family metallophosphoesterase [Candidatus Aminicenantes bacterium]
MPSKPVRLIMIGDVVGRQGRRFVQALLPLIKVRFQPDVVVANGENSAGGLGVIRRTADELFDAGINVLTGGNHTWDKKEALELLQTERRVLKPLNFPSATPGNGSMVYRTASGCAVLVVSLQGRVFMEPVVDNPFTAIDGLLAGNAHPVVLVDFHAEATAEKQAMGFFLDGRVSAVLGTHTHVPTSDGRVLEKGTAYQTDVGMTGALDSIIGMKREPIIRKFCSGMHQKFEVAGGAQVLDMTVVDVDPGSGRAVRIEAHRYFEETFTQQLNETNLGDK